MKFELKIECHTHRFENMKFCRFSVFNFVMLGEPSIKKNSLIDDIVQIGWVGHGLKPHFLKERNMDNYKGRVGQKSICPYFKN